MEDEDDMQLNDNDNETSNSYDGAEIYKSNLDADKMEIEPVSIPKDILLPNSEDFHEENLPSMNNGDGPKENVQPNSEETTDPIVATNVVTGADATPAEGTNTSDFKYKHYADGYHYYEDVSGLWYAQDDAGYWYYQETDGSFKLWDSQNNAYSTENVDDMQKTSADGVSKAFGEESNVGVTPVDKSWSAENNYENSTETAASGAIRRTSDPTMIVPLDADGRPQYPRGSDGKPILPIGPDGKKVFPLGKDNKPLFPVDENGTPTFPVGDDGQPVFPIGPQNKPIVPVDKNGRAVFPLGNDGMPIFPLGPDGKPTAPITVTDSRPVLPTDQNGKPIVPYGPDGQPLIHVGPDNVPIDVPMGGASNAAAGGDWNQYWQYYNYWNYYGGAGYGNNYSYPTNISNAGVYSGGGAPYSNHSYVGFGSNTAGKKVKVRPEDIDLPSGPAPPKKSAEDHMQTSFDGDRSKEYNVGGYNADGSSSPGGQSFNSIPISFDKKDSATKTLISKQIKAFAALQKFKKENENETRAASASQNAFNSSVEQENDKIREERQSKSRSDVYGPTIPPSATSSSVSVSEPNADASAQRISGEKQRANRWEPPPPGTQDAMAKLLNPPPTVYVPPPKLPEMRSHRSRSKSKSESHSRSHSKSRSGSRNKSRNRRRRSRSRTYSSRSRSRSRSTSPYRGGDRGYASRYNWRGRGGNGQFYRDDRDRDRWNRGGNNWRGGRYSRYSPRGPYRPKGHWQRSPSPDRRRRHSDRKSKSPSRSRSSSSSDKSEHSKESISRSQSPENDKSEQKLDSKPVADEPELKTKRPLVDYQPDEPIDDDQFQSSSFQLPAVSAAVIAEEEKIKVKDKSKEEKEIEWPKRIIHETRTVPILGFSCKPDLYESFVNLKKQFDETQKNQPSTKQEQDAILQPHKPISFGLVKLDATHVQRAVEPSPAEQSSKWKPLDTPKHESPLPVEGVQVSPVSADEIVEKLRSTPSKGSKKRKKGEPKIDPELENLRHAALLSMEKAQKDLAYYESVVKQTENIEPFVAEESADEDDDGQEIATTKKKAGHKKKVKKPKKRSKKSVDDEDSDDQKHKKRSKKYLGDDDSDGQKHKKRTKKAADDDESDDQSISSDEEEKIKKKKRASISKKDKKRSKKLSKKPKMHRKRKHSSSNDDVDDDEDGKDKNDSGESSDSETRIDKQRRKKKHRSRKTSTHSNLSDDRRKSKTHKKAKKKNSKKRKRYSVPPSSSDDADDIAEKQVEESQVETTKESATNASWMPKIHEIYLPTDSNASVKKQEFYELMMKGKESADSVPPPPPPPPKEKRKKAGALYVSANSPPPPPPPPFPRKESKSAILSPSSTKITPTLQQPVFVPVATYRPMAGVQQYGAPPPMGGYSNRK